MAGCDILDWRCIFVNEIFGSVTLALVLFTIFYFVLASKLKLGFDTTIAFSVPIILLLGLGIAGFQTIFAFVTITLALMIAWLFQIMIGNR